MALTREEREEFLAEPHIGSLAVTAEAGRAPLVVPLWYQYRPGGTLWVLTGADSRKAHLIEAAGRFTLLAERLQPSVRYVSAEGAVVESRPGTEEDLQEITYRYLGGQAAEQYLDFARTRLGEQVVIAMRPERWTSADLGSFG